MIVGGDWNATYDVKNSVNNLDILNTASIPSARRSAWLSQLCNDCNITDPFRYFFPESKEYTYVPFAAAATNRSRLDFFLITESLLGQCVKCRILHSLCFASSPRRPDREYKRMVFEYTHGLFIT